jgi:2-polyprenyl-3-methyl-5-hydroxy-6-metoxy-1,4-benzoquinol methylase
MSQQIESLQSARISSWGKINPARLDAVLQFAGQTILDVGCSTGQYVNYLNSKGYRAYGLDILKDPTWQTISPRNYAVADAEQLPVAPYHVQTVISFEVLEHTTNPVNVLREFHRICQKNVILSVPDCELPQDLLRAGMVYAHWRDRTHINFYTRELLREHLEEAGFFVTSITHFNPILPDYVILSSLHIPFRIAYFASRVLRRLPFRKKYYMTLLAIANKV